MAIDNTNTNRLFATAGEQKKPTGTGYTNLNRFFSANQGNQLGQKVTGGIQSQIGQVKGQLGQQQEQFQTEAEKNKLGSEEQKAERAAVIGRFSNPSTEAAGPSEQDIQKFQQFRGGQYSGPSGLKDTQALTSQAQDIRAQTSNLSPSGTQELLRRSVGGNNYTQGQQRLDSLLLDRSGLRAAGREAAGLGAGINQANLAAQGQAQALKSQAAQFGQETEQQLQGALSGLDVESQKQLASAQQAEQDRLARVQAVKDFAANKKAKVDAQGNPVLDQYGNPTYEEGTTRGASSDPYAQLDQLNSLLKSKGASQEELDQLFGTGQFTQNKSAYDQSMRDAAADLVASSGTLQQKIISQIDPYWLSQKKSNPKYYNQMLAGLSDRVRSGNLSTDFITPYTSNPDYYHIGDTSAYTSAVKAAEDKYGSMGIAGRAARNNQTEDLFKNLASTLSNSQGAQGLTETGVASQPLRANYTALQQLLGNTSDTLKYGGNEDQYQAGKFLLNPDQIKRSLGY